MNIIELNELNLIGVDIHTDMSKKDKQLPELWNNFMTRITEVKDKINPVKTYGYCAGEDEQCNKFHYIAAVESNTDDIPQEMVKKTIPAKRYALFTHKGSLTLLKDTYNDIYMKQIPSSDMKFDMSFNLEIYDERFKEESEESEFDILVPLI